MGWVVAIVLLFMSASSLSVVLRPIRVMFEPNSRPFCPRLSPFCVRFGSFVCISHVRVVVYFICTSFCPFRESVSCVCLRFLLFYCIVSVVICSFCRCICAVHSSAVLALLCVMFWFMLRACCHASNRRFMLCFHWSICVTEFCRKFVCEIRKYLSHCTLSLCKLNTHMSAGEGLDGKKFASSLVSRFAAGKLASFNSYAASYVNQSMSICHFQN